MNKTIILFTIASLLDFHSTIIQSPSSEENPILRGIWEQSTFGFITMLFVLYGIIIWILRSSKERVNKKLFPLILLVVVGISIFKIIIALTNYGLAPYWMTSWFIY